MGCTKTLRRGVHLVYSNYTTEWFPQRDYPEGPEPSLIYIGVQDCSNAISVLVDKAYKRLVKDRV